MGRLEIGKLGRERKRGSGSGNGIVVRSRGGGVGAERRVESVCNFKELHFVDEVIGGFWGDGQFE